MASLLFLEGGIAWVRRDDGRVEAANAGQCAAEIERLLQALKEEKEARMRGWDAGYEDGLHGAGLLPDARLLARATAFIGRMYDTGPECDCDAYGHSCGWPELSALAQELRAHQGKPA